MKSRGVQRKNRTQGADGVFLGHGVGQTHQGRTFEPNAQILRKRMLLPRGGRSPLGSAIRLTSCAHKSNTFQITLFYQKSAKIFRSIAGERGDQAAGSGHEEDCLWRTAKQERCSS